MANWRNWSGSVAASPQQFMTNADVEQMYPRLTDFLRTRQHYDPGQKFLNESFKTLFGV